MERVDGSSWYKKPSVYVLNMIDSHFGHCNSPYLRIDYYYYCYFFFFVGEFDLGLTNE